MPNDTDAIADALTPALWLELAEIAWLGRALLAKHPDAHDYLNRVGGRLAQTLHAGPTPPAPGALVPAALIAATCFAMTHDGRYVGRLTNLLTDMLAEAIALEPDARRRFALGDQHCRRLSLATATRVRHNMLTDPNYAARGGGPEVEA